MFSKGIFPRVIKHRDCMVKGYLTILKEKALKNFVRKEEMVLNNIF